MDGLHKCIKEGCETKTSHGSGRCEPHQPRCKSEGCKVKINYKKGYSRCAAHRKKASDPKLSYICEITGET